MTNHPNRSGVARASQPRDGYDAGEHVRLFLAAYSGSRVYQGDALLGELVDAVSISPTLPLRIIVLRPDGSRERMNVRGLRIEHDKKD